MEEQKFAGRTLEETRRKAGNWLKQNNAKPIAQSERTGAARGERPEEYTVIIYYETLSVGDQLKVRHGESTWK
jgi:sRNA-binding protein